MDWSSVITPAGGVIIEMRRIFDGMGYTYIDSFSVIQV